MIRIVLIGSGNVAFHLHRALAAASGVELIQMVARRPGVFRDFDPGIARAILDQPIAKADVYLLAVADGALEAVAARLRNQDGLVAHTSGARGLDALDGISRKGIFYPLQTFSRQRELDFADIPLCIETSLPEDLPLLRNLAESLSGRVLEMDEEKRRQLHLAAVFVNNFSNHMVCLGETLCREKGLPENILRPLLRETFSKLDILSAYQAQTGPARRGDTITQQAHLGQLKDSLQRELYQVISESIRQTYD